MRKTVTIFAASLCLCLSSFSQNKALHFDGADDYVQVPARTGVLTGSTITFETWVKPSSFDGSFMPIVNKGNGTNYFLVYFSNNAMDPWDPPTIGLGVFAYNGSANGQVYQNISDNWIGQWHHVAATINGTTMFLYIDGTLVQSAPFSGGVPVTNENVYIGSGGAYDVFNGTLDELRIWNTTRTQSEIQASMNTEVPAGSMGLTAYYKFNQGTIDGNNTAITTLSDAVALPNTGTLMNFAKTGNTSNFTSGYGSISVLAIKEGSFTAAKKGNAVQLGWKSTPTDGTSLYTIERSSNGTDFARIGSVNGASFMMDADYSFTDAAPHAANNYYRIKTTEANGRVSYTRTIALAMNKAIGLQVFPNPAAAQLQLQLTVPKGVVAIELKDMTGRILQTKQITSQGTTIYTTLDLSSLVNGIYLVSVGKETRVFSKQ